MENIARPASVNFPPMARRSIALIEREVAPADASGSEVATANAPAPAPAGKRSRWLAVVPFLVLLPLFYGFAWLKGEKTNSGMQPGKEYHSIFYHDQHAYLSMAKKMRLSGYHRVETRHRTPGYAFLLSALYSPKDDYVSPTGGENDPRLISDAYFNRAKHFNIALSLISVVALFFICRRFLPPLESHVVTWSYAFLVAVIKAPYVQPEVAFYVVILLALVMLWRLLVQPRWWLAALAGAVLVTAFLLKSTVLPLIALYVICAGILFAKKIWEARGKLSVSEWRSSLAGLGVAAIVPVVFVVLLIPYFNHTKAMYGEPLWDVHSRHYMWMESKDDLAFWRSQGIMKPEFEAPEGKVIPTAETYLQSHTLTQMVDREKAGWQSIRNLVKKEYHPVYDLTKHLMVWVLVMVALMCWRRTREAFIRHWVEWLLVLGFLGGYGFLYGWFQAVGVGPRLILTLFLPAFFFAILGIHRLSAPMILQFFHWQTPLRYVVSGVMIGFILISGIGVLSGDLWVVEGGH